MKIYFTGGSGYLGTNLLFALVQDQTATQIRTLATSPADVNRLRLLLNNPGKLEFEISNMLHTQFHLQDIDIWSSTSLP